MNQSPSLLPLLYDEVVRRALAEDLGRAGDLTTDAIVPADLAGRAAIVARAAGRVAGLEPALHAFRLLDPECKADVHLPDGRDAVAGEAIAHVSARARALLTGERTALNLLGRLGGIATATRDIVARLDGLKPRVVSTRKTTPGLNVAVSATAMTAITPACTGSLTTRSAASGTLPAMLRLITSMPRARTSRTAVSIAPPISEPASTSARARGRRVTARTASASGVSPTSGIVSTEMCSPRMLWRSASEIAPIATCPTWAPPPTMITRLP